MSILKPSSELPWKFEHYEPDFGDAYDRVTDVNNSTWDVMNNKDYYSASVDVKDMKYIVQACNNFPKAIELLKELELSLDAASWDLNSGILKTKSNQITEFLKSLEKDGEHQPK
jgi:hypothetical protein